MIEPCLLHRDYHEMTSDCWEAVVTWFSLHQDIPHDRRCELYQQEVEAAVLGDLWTVGR